MKVISVNISYIAINELPIYVIYYTVGPVATGSVRISGGRNIHEGYVEIYQNGQWGTICHDSWNLHDGRVVCSQLGYVEVENVDCCKSTQPKSGPFWIAALNCTGSESSIQNCPGFQWRNVTSTSSCSRNGLNPATVTCAG